MEISVLARPHRFAPFRSGRDPTGPYPKWCNIALPFPTSISSSVAIDGNVSAFSLDVQLMFLAVLRPGFFKGFHLILRRNLETAQR